ncbi:phosphotransferase [Rhizobiaceae bacterium BDR2-2]|uniref:Hydroxylysine kinase n=1 Tax=Ectorhizobium quercum TaxID=2965071 RepID=A0AAE3N3V9_9HYPH|nr:phosphotransferase [Ectorhizobium quercum]MCX8998027.1 phosphotransferase [Ectorhizobium quercum]
MTATAVKSPTVGAELKTEAVIVSAEEAQAIARDRYGLDGRAEWLWGEKDSNYRLSLADGTEYLLKILNPAESRAVTAMHSQALIHVAARDPDIPVQRIIRTLDGEADFRMVDAGGQERSVRMVTFVPGRAQKSAPHSRTQRRAVGVWLARMQNALADFTHEAAHHRITWDMKHASGLRDLLPAFGDRPIRARLEKAVDDFDARIVPAMAGLPAQVVHNDFNMENILVDPDDPDRISGIIDFGDMVHAPLLFDVAVGAAYQMGEEEDPVAAACDFLEGYASLRTLGAAELDLLYPAIVTRLAMRLVIPEWRCGLFPDQRPFLTRNSPTVERQFARLDAIGAAQAARRLQSVFK